MVSPFCLSLVLVLLRILHIAPIVMEAPKGNFSLQTHYLIFKKVKLNQTQNWCITKCFSNKRIKRLLVFLTLLNFSFWKDFVHSTYDFSLKSSIIVFINVPHRNSYITFEKKLLTRTAFCTGLLKGRRPIAEAYFLHRNQVQLIGCESNLIPVIP